MKIQELLVLDASVIYKWFIDEIYKDKALKLRAKISSSESSCVIPDLLIYEFSNALRYNTDYSNEDIKSAIRSLYDMEIDIVAPIPDIHDTAVDIARAKNITIYDAYYVALAKEIGYIFITADKKLYKNVKSMNFVRFLGNFI